jgi:WXG100 family type VII secretion target
MGGRPTDVLPGGPRLRRARLVGQLGVVHMQRPAHAVAVLVRPIALCPVAWGALPTQGHRPGVDVGRRATRRMRTESAPPCCWRCEATFRNRRLTRADILFRMAQLTTDATVLAKEAANFERIAESLKDQVTRVQQTATELIADHNWKGSARNAAQAALNRYVEAAQSMTRGLNDNSTNLHKAGLLYQATDEEQSSRLAQAMGFGDDTDGKQHGHMQTADAKHDGHIQQVDNHGSGGDQALVTDPHADPTARHLAQERLDDLKNANLVGPPIPDPVLGGDSRTRAQARRQFQRFLESGQAYPDRPPLTPDQATQLLDKWETNSRNMILGDFGQRLQAAGVSPPGVERALDEIRSGKTPADVFRDVADGMSKYGGALGGGAESHGAAIPHGQHWANTPVWSEADAKALEGFGRQLTKAGVGLDALVTGYDVANGAPLGPAAAEFGGRAAGGFAGGWAAGSLWGSLVGPEGTLIVGLLGGIAGAAGGDELVKAALGE